MTELLLPNSTYHIFNHANGLENLFRSDENKRFFLERYTRHIAPIADTYAYCLMNNHFHLLLKIKEKAEIEKIIIANTSSNSNLTSSNSTSTLTSSKVQNFGKGIENDNIKSDFSNENNIVYQHFISRQFANFFSSYSQAFNKMYGRMGSLFIKNFKREEVLTEAYFRELVVYIHRNPVHHGFCNHFSDWNFSSYNCLAKNEDSNFLDKETVIQAFGGTEAFIEVHEDNLRKHLLSTQLDI